MLLEGIHFNLQSTPLQHLGYKALAVNVSDMAAMHALPRHAVLSLGISSCLSVKDIEALYEGLGQALQRYDVSLVGGDTTASATGLVLSVSLVGEAAADSVTYRDQARLGDDIWVSGDLGAAYVGLKALEEKQKHRAYPREDEEAKELAKHHYVISRQLRPEARTDIGAQLREAGVLPHAMIDLSDGLCADLMKLCKASGVGARLYESALPIAKPTRNSAALLGIDVLHAACYGGEDYELLFTTPPTKRNKLLKLASQGTDLHLIGQITQAAVEPRHDTSTGCVMENEQGTYPLNPTAGWAHFSKKPTAPQVNI